MRKSRSPAKPGRVLREPPYLMRDVPHCKKDQLMRGKSCVQKVASRREWVACLSEMLMLCNEAEALRGTPHGGASKSLLQLHTTQHVAC